MLSQPTSPLSFPRVRWGRCMEAECQDQESLNEYERAHALCHRLHAFNLQTHALDSPHAVAFLRSQSKTSARVVHEQRSGIDIVSWHSTTYARIWCPLEPGGHELPLPVRSRSTSTTRRYSTQDPQAHSSARSDGRAPSPAGQVSSISTSEGAMEVTRIDVRRLQAADEQFMTVALFFGQRLRASPAREVRGTDARTDARTVASSEPQAVPIQTTVDRVLLVRPRAFEMRLFVLAAWPGARSSGRDPQHSTGRPDSFGIWGSASHAALAVRTVPADPTGSPAVAEAVEADGGASGAGALSARRVRHRPLR
eukprot:gene15609-biopygen4118